MSDESPALTGTQGAATQSEQSIAIIVEHRPEIVLLDEGKRDQLFAHIEAEVAAFVPDMTTTKGRDECRSLAAKVTKTKTAVDKARLQLTEDARAKIKTINESGATIKEKLEALAETARAPLTAWETAEDARQALCKGALDRMRAAAIVPLGATSDGLKTRIVEVEAENMAEDQWLGMLELATETRATALAALKTALELIEQKERDAAELAALRAEAEARAAREAEETAAREKAETEKAQRNAYIDAIIQHITEVGLGMIGGKPYPYVILIAELEEKVPPEIVTFGDRREEVERHRVATLERVREAMARSQEREAAEAAAEDQCRREENEARARQTEEERAVAAERTRIATEQAATLAAERARAEEAARAEQQAAEQSAAHEAELAAAAARVAEAERIAQAERDDRAAADARRANEEAAAAAQRARLEQDQERRRQAKTEAKEAIMQAGVTEDQAQKIVLLIISGEIPRVILDFSARGRNESD